MMSIGEILTRCLRRGRDKRLDEELVTALLRTSKDARRKVLEDLHDAEHPSYLNFYRAVLELSKSEGDVESLTFGYKVVDEPAMEPHVGDLIREMYGRR